MLKLNDESENMYYLVRVIRDTKVQYELRYMNLDIARDIADSICSNLAVTDREYYTRVSVIVRTRSLGPNGRYVYRYKSIKTLYVNQFSGMSRSSVLVSKLPTEDTHYDLVEISAFKAIPGGYTLPAIGCCYYANSGAEKNLYRTINGDGKFDLGYYDTGEIALYYSFKNPDSVLDTLKVIVYVSKGGIVSGGLGMISMSALYRGEKSYRLAPLSDIKSSFELEVR